MIKWPEPLLTVDEKLSSIIPAGTRLHTEQSLKQAVRDALKRAAELARTKMSGLGAEAAIRALIKEIPHD